MAWSFCWRNEDHPGGLGQSTKWLLKTLPKSHTGWTVGWEQEHWEYKILIGIEVTQNDRLPNNDCIQQFRKSSTLETEFKSLITYSLRLSALSSSDIYRSFLQEKDIHSELIWNSNLMVYSLLPTYFPLCPEIVGDIDVFCDKIENY